MTVYYLFQHLLLSLALALCAICLPKWFYMSALPRALLAASLTPQVIGLLVMILALSGVHEPVIYMHAPLVIGAALLIIAAVRFAGHGWQWPMRWRIKPAGIAVTVIGLVLAAQLGMILLNNAKTLNVFHHDFNVYLSAAKAFAASPGIESMPSFFGEPGDLIVVHPHSFIYEAYLSHAAMLEGTDPSFPPLDYLPRLAQQLTMVYMLLAIAGATVAMGGRWEVVAALCLVVSIPWVYYITESLERDSFRMTPLLGFVVVLSSLGLNFSSALVRRALLTGAYAALAVMSHTMGLMLSVIIGGCVLGYTIVRRRPGWRALWIYLIPLVTVAGLSVLRYAQNYLETGSIMGYGLQYSIYKGTWLEPVLAQSWTDKEQNLKVILLELLHRYGWYMQLLTLAVSCLAAFFIRGRGRVTYLAVLVGLWAPLLIALSGVVEYSGINMRSALMANARYALTFFMLSGPLLAVGIARMGNQLANTLRVHSVWRLAAVAAATCLAAWVAQGSMQNSNWRSHASGAEDIKQVRFLSRASRCLKHGQHWFIDHDRWQPYFMEHQPVFIFTLPGRPLLLAPDVHAMEAELRSMNIKFAAFIQYLGVLQASPLYEYIHEHWVRIPMSGGSVQLELWIAPEMIDCVGVP